MNTGREMKIQSRKIRTIGIFTFGWEWNIHLVMLKVEVSDQQNPWVALQALLLKSLA